MPPHETVSQLSCMVRGQLSAVLATLPGYPPQNKPGALSRSRATRVTDTTVCVPHVSGIVGLDLHLVRMCATRFGNSRPRPAPGSWTAVIGCWNSWEGSNPCYRHYHVCTTLR